MPMLRMRSLFHRGVRPLIQEQTAAEWQSCIDPGPPGTLAWRHEWPVEETGSSEQGTEGV